ARASHATRCSMNRESMNFRGNPATRAADASRGTLRLVMYLVAALILMTADHRAGYLDALRERAATFRGPLYWLAASPARVARDVTTAVTDQRAVLAENHELREALLRAQAKLSRQSTMDDENTRLRALLGTRYRLALEAQMAAIVDVDLDPFRQRVVLDAGSEQGVRVGQALMDARGLLGQVIEAPPQRAIALLITDASHTTPVEVVRTGLRTFAFGTGNGERLRLPYIPFSADVKVGDELVTSGLGRRFPAGLPVAKIITIEADDSGTFAVATARPAADLLRHGEVLLLREERVPIAADANKPGATDAERPMGPPALPAGVEANLPPASASR
ncbi:MAG: rod shape-determining protein MreC, partial [Lysobacterales bacterium]